MLQLFLSNPNRSYYVREITRKIGEQINSVRRELSNLLNIGIIVSENTNNRLYYEVNQKYEFYDPLKAIFGSGSKVTAKVSSKNDQKDDIKALGNIDLLIFTGQFTRDESAGIDLFIVGNTNTHAVQKFVTELEEKEGKELRYTVINLEDFKYRQQVKDRFVMNILASKKQIMIDSHGLLESA